MFPFYNICTDIVKAKVRLVRQKFTVVNKLRVLLNNKDLQHYIAYNDSFFNRLMFDRNKIHKKGTYIARNYVVHKNI